MEELAAADVKVSTETLAAASGWTVALSPDNQHVGFNFHSISGIAAG
ncbi:oxidoreductase [Aspergillus luchuensis]|uniref:Oxidoreductase n=1 Tax=Aspergillus kawachii TaxID=1069201 RepID=A0A146FHM0_ASPKA|nr:oxidoreductase [Aspergillus luchuensis]